MFDTSERDIVKRRARKELESARWAAERALSHKLDEMGLDRTIQSSVIFHVFGESMMSLDLPSELMDEIFESRIRTVERKIVLAALDE